MAGYASTPWHRAWWRVRAPSSRLTAKQAWELVAPLHRVATAEDISDVCLALVATRYVTGQTLLVDGGLALMI